MIQFYSTLIRKAFVGVIIFIACVVLANSSRAAEFAKLQIPNSDRVLTVQEVKNYWINQVTKMPIPKKPTGLHPEKRQQWSENLEKRKSFLAAVRSGVYDTQAKLVQLEHNIEAWRRLGNDEKSLATTKQLHELREHLTQLEVLELQRRAAQAQINAADKIKVLEAEISAIRSSCSHACCSH